MNSSVGGYGHHLSATTAYVVVAVLAAFAVLGIIRKIIALALLAGLVAIGVALYHQGVLNGLVGSG